MRPYLVRYVSLHFLTVICFCSILMVHVLVRKPFKNECPIPLILYTRVFITHHPHGLWGIFEIWTGEGILSMASSWFRCVEESSSRRHVTMNFSSLISRCFFNVSIFFVRKMHVPCLRLSKTAGEVADMHWVTRGSAVVIFKDAESAKKATETLHKSNLALPWIPLDANKTPKNLGTWEETHTNIRDISEFGKLSWGLENDNALSKTITCAHVQKICPSQAGDSILCVDVYHLFERSAWTKMFNLWFERLLLPRHHLGDREE